MRTLIRNGTVIDPSQRIHSRLDLLLEDGKVAGLTSQPVEAGHVIDAEGKIVCPGFIDIHMHEDPWDPQEDRLQPDIMNAMLRMGVTTAVGGNCGINTTLPSRYLDLMDRDGGPVNMGLLAGHGFLRELAGHRDKYTPVTDGELEEIRRLVRQQLEAGCLGVSFGISYSPGLTRREMLAAAEGCREGRKLIAAHVRNDAEYVFDAVRELVDVGRALDIPVENSHVGSMGGFGQMERLLAMLDEYRANGLDLTSDCYPYYAFSTRIGETTYDDGFLERYRCDYRVIDICEGPYKGQRCTPEIFRELRETAPRTLTVCHVMRSEDVDAALLHPAVMVASDGLLDSGQGHPRAAGTFPRFLRNYALAGRLTMDEAIRKITWMPARKLGLKNKGTLRPGADADVTVFDPAVLRDGATFDAPTAPPAGITAVLIGGETALSDGTVVRSDLGRSVRRP